MALRRPDLLSSPAVTIFVPSDKALFSKPHGFRYDFRRHVVPKRLRFNELMAYTDGAEFETLAPNKSVFVQSGDDAVSVNGVRADGGEIYHNRWIVLHSLPTTLDDAAAGEFLGFSNWLPSSPETGGKFSGEMTNYLDAGQVSNGVPTPAPESNIELIVPPSPTPAQETHFIGPIQIGVPGVPPVSDQDHVEDMISELIRPPTPSPSIGDATNDQCGVVPGVTVRVDNADLICPVSDVLNMQENEVKPFPDVAPFQPSDGVDGTQLQLSKKLLQSEPLISDIHHTDELKIEKGRVSDKRVKQDPDLSNIAGDLFYYT
ncbi:hypothetical protein ACH5RR_000570 [Cinchona calisaya]|uniref:FAS1 domain-containing protein n=1 Tax=Cinchona calisaya TaxID=153742 RepID=A0ABD3B158_9GENT